MSQPLEVRICVLWEREVRIAAKAIKQAVAILNAKDAGTLSIEESRAIFDALDAGYAALRGADEDGASIVLSTRAVVDWVDATPRVAAASVDGQDASKP